MVWARPSQLEPPGDWNVWLVQAGRGFGKTRIGSEWVRERARLNPKARIAIVGATAADARDTMVEGESGVLAVSPPWFRPGYEPSKRRLTWPNGARATLFSAEEPDRLRGPQHTDAWADELAAWERDEDTWDQLQLGLRLGQRPRVVVTTTPRPTKLVKALAKDAGTFVTRGSTYDNRANLSRVFLDKITKAYEGTRLGRQELYAELLEDTPGALWTLTQLEALRVSKAPPLRRVVVAVDPSVSATDNSDECGIVVAGIGDHDGHGYILADLSGVMSPHDWATKAVWAYHHFQADAIVVETNNGGEMIELTIKTIDRSVRVKSVHASRGKRTRAEPVAALDEQGSIHHVGVLKGLEDQMTTWDATSASRSPDRVDARVWAITDLMLGTAGQRTVIHDYDETDYE